MIEDLEDDVYEVSDLAFSKATARVYFLCESTEFHDMCMKFQKIKNYH